MKNFMKSSSLIAALFMLSPLASYADNSNPSAMNPNSSNPSSANPSSATPNSSNPSASNPSSSNPGAAAGPLVIQIAQNPAGSYLTDSQGKPLYIFSKDSSDKPSVCTEQCAQVFQPVIVQQGQMPQAMGGADTGKLTTIPRNDGGKQLAYHGMPLYYFSGDQAPGQVNGQNQNAFGGTFNLVQPNGDKLSASVSPSTSSGTPSGGTSMNPSAGGASNPSGGSANPSAGGPSASNPQSNPSNPQSNPANPQGNPSTAGNPSSTSNPSGGHV